jgi:hypothetical protein
MGGDVIEKLKNVEYQFHGVYHGCSMRQKFINSKFTEDSSLRKVLEYKIIVEENIKGEAYA